MMKKRASVKPVFPFILILIILVFSSFRPVVVHGTSMEPVLKENSFQIFCSGILIKLFPVKKGDIVLFHDPEGDKTLVKRVVLLPGETYHLEQGCLIIDQSSLVLTRRQYEILLHEKAGSETLFVLGNNLYNSRDSRDFGFIKKSDIIGRYISWSKADNS